MPFSTVRIRCHFLMSSSPPLSAALDSIHCSLSSISSSDCDSFYPPRHFSAFAHRLHLLLDHLLRSLSSPAHDDLPTSIQTAIRGISSDLADAAETTSVYRKRSKIFVLIHCESLCASLLQRTLALGAWLALISSSLHEDDDVSDLRKKTDDLSRDMKQARFKVTENEERVYCMLLKEGEGRSITSKAVQSAIIMDLARALGIDSGNHVELAKQVNLFKNDLVASSNSLLERKILVFLEKILDSLLVEKMDTRPLNLNLNFEEDAHISPFKNFLCPLTKEIMKEPVLLESSQTYERKAIEYWFHRCIEDGRQPTCPVTGQVLKSLDLKQNFGLAGAIGEWITKYVDIHVKYAVEHLNKEPVQVDCIEGVLDSVYKISEEVPSNRYRVRNAGIVTLIVNLLRNSSNSIGTRLRGKGLMALLSVAKDEESKAIMVQEGIIRLAIRSLTGSSEKEREYAVKLLLDFAHHETYCVKITSEKGALVLLSSMAENREHFTLSNLAEEVLKKMEMVEDNIQPLAAVGRFEPLLNRLCEGSDAIKIEMASIVGSMTLTNSSKEQIARQSAKILVSLLSKPGGVTPSLQALYNLSSLDDNATILINSGVLPSIMNILFENDSASSEQKDLAASTVANIVSNTGHWELASADKQGNLMQSESTVLRLLELLSVISYPHVSILRILYGLASSPQAAESVVTHIKTGEGIRVIIPFLKHPEVDHRIYAFRLARLLSERFCQDLSQELKPNKLSLLKDKLLDETSTEGERSDAALILANILFSEDEVKTLLGPSFLRWIVLTLKNQQCSTNGRISHLASNMVEGLLGLLLRFIKSFDQSTLSTVREFCLMTILCELLGFPKPRVKRLAVLGLKHLSEAGSLIAASSDPPPQNRLCASLALICGRGSPKPSTCPIHNIFCDDSSQLCLLESGVIKPLLECLKDRDTDVQIAVVEALSTLIVDTSSISKQAINTLEQQGVVDAVILLFTEVRPGELQEKAIWMIDRILKVDSCSHQHSLHQSLVRALVEAFKYGNANTKRYAQNALTNLKQMSEISGKT